MILLPRVNRIGLFGIILFAAGTAAMAQEPSLEQIPGLREQAVVLDIVSRVVEQNQQEVWKENNSRVTIPGRPVGLKLVGANVVVLVQFTPYPNFGADGSAMLVAQVQIWINIPNQGVRYQTTMQTIPLKYGEQIYFFPLGSMDSQDDARIEIQLELRPYTGADTDPSAGQDRAAPEEPGNEIPK
ncbi:hypothetical protein AGMMS50268_10940 [Spirochaetia bacterium]|nr:hypothetical protein AGMMS49546_26910 [Spirochaetia bacterium]GHV90591.1 hypothetical protein AGMMS50268_10940 [Spirochaetia bacterium]